ncbi:MAG: hypothetical protein JWQ87_2179 [Candidatus Sulfotelmatobacter sp.]|nr:hypothetical protein [Candidatus Sulfotelmatobacter sp.]
MRFTALFLALGCSVALAQTASSPLSVEPKIVTVPLALDHNRVVINAEIPLPDGSTQQVRAWVDNGNPDLWMSRRVAGLMGTTIVCNGQVCSATLPNAVQGIVIAGGMKILLPAKSEIKVPLRPPSAAAVLAPGMNAEIIIPSTVLRQYDVLIDFPDHKFTIGQPGTVKFRGTKTKAIVNGENGLIEVPSQIENKKYLLGLDIGSSFNFLSGELFDKLASAHHDWPQMTGAIGPANMWGLGDEAHWKVMRLDRVQYGPLFLTNVAVSQLPKDRAPLFESRGVASTGLLGAEALVNYRIGIDYAHSAVYFEIGRTFNFPDFDVVGLTLRPEDNGSFTILAVTDYEGKASVADVQSGDQLVAVDGIPVRGVTMGQVWLMLGGEPGKERRLTVERDGKQFTVSAKVRHFLAEAMENAQTKSHGN